MLILSRKVGEDVVIGGEGGLPRVVVRVMEIRHGGRVAVLGIEADRHVPLMRGELLERPTTFQGRD